MSDVCPHGEVSRWCCTDCMLDPPPERPVPPLLGTVTFSAQLPGTCECGEAIVEGQRITRMTDGTYQHVRCVKRWQGAPPSC